MVRFPTKRTCAESRREHREETVSPHLCLHTEEVDGEGRLFAFYGADGRWMILFSIKPVNNFAPGRREENIRPFIDDLHESPAVWRIIRLPQFLLLDPERLPSARFWKQIAAFSRRLLSIISRLARRRIVSQRILRLPTADDPDREPASPAEILTAEFPPPPEGFALTQADPEPAEPGLPLSPPDWVPSQEILDRAARRSLTPFRNRPASLLAAQTTPPGCGDPQPADSQNGSDIFSDDDSVTPDPRDSDSNAIRKALQRVIILPPHPAAWKASVRFLQQSSAAERLPAGPAVRISREELRRLGKIPPKLM